MIKKLIFLMYVSITVFIAACATFVMPGDEPRLKEYESKKYVMKKSIEIDDKKLNKGEVIRIIITTGGEWIKVHGYSVREDELKVDRVLLLFLFEEDFKDGIFSLTIFDQKLREIVAEIGSAKDKKKKKSDW